MRILVNVFRKSKRPEAHEKLYPPWSAITICPFTGQILRTSGYSSEEVVNRLVSGIAQTKREYDISEISEISLEI